MKQYVILLLLSFSYLYAMDNYPESSNCKYDSGNSVDWKTVFTHELMHLNILYGEHADFCYKRYFPEIKELLDKGADPNIVKTIGGFQMSILMWVTQCGSKKDIRYLIDKAANVNYCNEQHSVLSRAVSWKRRSIVQYLIKKGANVDLGGKKGSPLSVAVAEYICSNSKRSKKILDCLLKNKANINTQTAPPLKQAIQVKDEKLIKLLIDNGGDVNNFRGINKQSLLFVFSFDSYLAQVELLLKAGIDVNHRASYGETVLHCIARKPGDRMSVLHKLLEYGADPNISQSDGNTPLMEAVLFYDDRPAVIQSLLDGGADPSHSNREGKRAVDLAREKDDQFIVSLLSVKKIP